MAKLSSIARDVKKEQDGVWQVFMYDIEVRIARWDNARFKEAVRAEARRNPELAKYRSGKSVDEETLLEAMKPLVAEYVCLDWRNVLDDDETEIEYSPINALDVFNKEEYLRFYRWIIETSRLDELYLRNETQNIAKN